MHLFLESKATGLHSLHSLEGVIELARERERGFDCKEKFVDSILYPSD